MHKEQHEASTPSTPSTPSIPSTPSTLLAATIDLKDRVEFVEYADGSVGIRINDESLEGYKWDASHAEDGVRTYMRLVHRG